MKLTDVLDIFQSKLRLGLARGPSCSVKMNAPDVGADLPKPNVVYTRVTTKVFMVGANLL